MNSESIEIYGNRGRGDSFEDFARMVFRRNQARKSLFLFGNASKKYLSALVKKGVSIKTDKVVITDGTTLKYKNHPKRAKGAFPSMHRFRTVSKAVKNPKNVYIDKHRSRLIFVSTSNYDKNRVTKVVIEPNQKIKGQYYNKVVSIGVVEKSKMKDPMYEKIK